MIIGYLRVSTKQQGNSGLGLEAQQFAIDAHCAHANDKLLATYVEIESGKNSARPELAKALLHARRSKATLVVAKLDRLSRNVAFLSAVMDSGVPFSCVDQPLASRLTLHILAAVAEAEAVAISQRTKAALAAYRARGGLLGAQIPECRNLTWEARMNGAISAGKNRTRQRDEAYTDILPMARELREQGLSLTQVAGRLNEAGHTTRTGRPWTKVAVCSILKIGRKVTRLWPTAISLPPKRMETIS